LRDVKEYYSAKIEKYGATPAGVDWNSLASQKLRFEQLSKIINKTNSISINDFGCGYGALLDYLIGTGLSCHYYGFDISETMIKKAMIHHASTQQAKFFVSSKPNNVSDYTVASGIFNVRNKYSEEEWFDYICQCLQHMNRYSSKGFSFNCLTTYSDEEFMRSDLYYADPVLMFDYCKSYFSANVALLHDYDLYEFTILVRK